MIFFWVTKAPLDMSRYEDFSEYVLVFAKLALGRSRAAPLGVDDFGIRVPVIARIDDDVRAGEAGAYFGALPLECRGLRLGSTLRDVEKKIPTLCPYQRGPRSLLCGRCDWFRS